MLPMYEAIADCGQGSPGGLYQPNQIACPNPQIPIGQQQTLTMYNGSIVRGVYTFPRIIEYKVDNVPKFAVNPASELTIKSIEAALIFHPTPAPNRTLTTTNKEFWGPIEMDAYNPITQAKPFTQRMNESGFEIETWRDDPNVSTDDDYVNQVWYRTPFLPLSCITNASFKAFENTISDIHLKVKVVFTRNDANGQAREVVLVFTYNVETEEIESWGLLNYHIGSKVGAVFNCFADCDLRRNFVDQISASPFGPCIFT